MVHSVAFILAIEVFDTFCICFFFKYIKASNKSEICFERTVSEKILDLWAQMLFGIVFKKTVYARKIHIKKMHYFSSSLNVFESRNQYQYVGLKSSIVL